MRMGVDDFVENTPGTVEMSATILIVVAFAWSEHTLGVACKLLLVSVAQRVSEPLSGKTALAQSIGILNRYLI